VVRIANSSAERRLPRALIREALDRAYRARRRKPAAMDLAVLDDDAIRRLNRRHLFRDRATDVLAFDDGEEEQDGRLRLGDVAISAGTARREAAARGVPFRNELIFYALHGLLHLMGMRDDDDEGRRRMHLAQAKTLGELGLKTDDSFPGDALARPDGE
jgi:probable rRNA maturation factor